MGKYKQLPLTGDWKVRWEESNILSHEIINFIEALPTPEGDPFILLPWQKDFIRKTFKTKQGKRIVRNSLLCIARKNGKTTLNSGIILAHFFIKRLQKKSAQLVSLGCDKNQAALMFNMMCQILQQCPELIDELHIVSFHKTITHVETGMTYRSLISVGERLAGLSAYLACCDEVGEYPNAKAFHAVKSSTGFHDEALCMMISTSAETDEHVWSQEVRHALNAEDETYYAKVYQADPDDPLGARKTMLKANPSLGAVRKEHELRSFYKQCKTIPAQLPVYKRYYLNIPNIRTSKSEEVWISRKVWDMCGIDRFEKLDKAVCVGLDMSSTLDLTALAVIDKAYRIQLHVWCARQALEDLATQELYGVWIQKKLMNVSVGLGIDFKVDVRPKLLEICDKHDVRVIAYDPWRLETIEAALEEVQIYKKVIPVKQSAGTQTQAIEKFERLVVNNQLRHNSNPILNWSVANAVISRDSQSNRKLTKTYAKDKIDPLSAVMNAIFVSKALETKPADYSDMFIDIAN